jgi:hypothetical protein
MAAIARHWWVAGSVTRLTGFVDEVRVYDRALSEKEILALNPSVSRAAVGVWRPSDGRFRLDANATDRWDGPSGGDRVTATFGVATDVPVAGRW